MGLAKPRRAEDSGTPEGRTSYEGDFYTWTQEQAAMLRAGRLTELDLEHLAEEIEDLGKEQFKQLTSAYRTILIHMLKWDHQPDRRSRSWAGSIATQRVQARHTLDDNPGLRSRIDVALARAYERAKIEAATQMRLDRRSLPPECPYSLDEIMTREFEWPER